MFPQCSQKSHRNVAPYHRTPLASIDHNTSTQPKNKASRKRPNRPKRKLMLKDVGIIKTLGAGTEGTVCLGRRYCSKKQSPNARFFAVKVTLPPEKDWQSQLGNALPSLDNDIDPKNESSILRKLPWHPFVNGILTHFLDEDRVVSVIEYIPSWTLTSVIGNAATRSQMDDNPTIARFLFGCIALGVDFLHRNDIAHLDIKSDNILISACGYPVLTDFGFSNPIAGRGFKPDAGTPPYCPLERLMDDLPWTLQGMDWWAVGCVLYEMVQFAYAFEWEDREGNRDVLQQVAVCRTTTPIEELWCSNKCKEVLRGLLAVEADERYAFREIENSRYMRNVEWKKLERMEYPAPMTLALEECLFAPPTDATEMPDRQNIGANLRLVPQHLRFA
ncbi:kinase-like domain-containing protein [Mucidula mucida]|nr:kinase-like domain-containing protein [Mucidula mucida]